MQISEFIEETSKIEQYFVKELDDYQREIWYNELKDIDLNRYRQIIRQVFRKCKFMPKLADILDINDTLPYTQNINKQRATVECKRCKGVGAILYTKKINDGGRDLYYTYAARCECQNGLEFVYDGTKISDTKHRSKFYIKTAAEVGI